MINTGSASITQDGTSITYSTASNNGGYIYRSGTSYTLTLKNMEIGYVTATSGSGGLAYLSASATSTVELDTINKLYQANAG